MAPPKTLGAVYLQSGAAAVPYSAASERALLQLHHDIYAAAGSSMVLQSKVLAGEGDAISAFNAARANEYVMVIGKGQRLVQRIEQEHQAERFSVAGLEDNELDLARLQTLLAQIRARDVFGAQGREAAESLLSKCAEALEQ
jgi:hypothetical protein